MVCLSEALDPTRTGSQAEDLEQDLRRMIVGQQEAIHEIVSMYQMFLTGMNPPDVALRQGNRFAVSIEGGVATVSWSL